MIRLGDIYCELMRPGCCQSGKNFLVELIVPSGKRDIFLACANCTRHMLEHEPDRIIDFCENE